MILFAGPACADPNNNAVIVTAIPVHFDHPLRVRLELGVLSPDAALLSGDDVDFIGESDCSSNVGVILADALVVLLDGDGVGATDGSQNGAV